MIDKINFDKASIENQINKVKDLKSKAKSRENKELYNVALEFEAIFIKQMLDSMKTTINKEKTLLHGGQIEDIFENMLYEKRAQNIATTKNFGIADIIYKQLKEIDNLKK